MFCPQCGMKNEDDAVFCSNCGADVSQAFSEAVAALSQGSGTESQSSFLAPAQNFNPSPTYAYQAGTVAVKPRTPVKTSTKVILAIIVALAVACAVLYNVARQMSSPEEYARNYFEAIQDKDWAKTYSFLGVTESDFINESNFAQMMGKSVGTEKIVNYSILNGKAAKEGNNKSDGSGDQLKSGLTKAVTVQYTTQGDTEPQTLQVLLIKQPEKKFLFFDTWKVSPADYITPKLSVTVPYGTTAYLNNVKIDEKYKTESNSPSDSSDTSGNSADQGKQPVNYLIKNIFTGTYTLKVTSPYTEDYTQTIPAQGNDANAEINSLKLKQTVLDEVSKQPEEIIRNLYASALAGKDFDSVKDYFDPSADVQNNMKQRYHDVLSSIATSADSTSGFKSISFSDFQPQVVNSEAGPNMAVTVQTSFDYSFTGVEPSFYGSDSPTQEYSGSNSDTINFEFELSDGKWLVSDANDFTLPNYNSYY